MEYQAFPRASAIAEVGWTPKAQKDFTDFRVRLDHHLRRLDAFGLNYRDPGNRISQTIGTWKPGETNETFQTKTWPLKDFLKGPGTVQIQFQYTGGEHRLDIAWARITANRTPVAEDRHLGITGFDSKDSTYTLEIDAFDPEAEYALEARVRSDGGANSQGEIFLYRQIP
jgi:hexosaminidase